ncbi:conserved hypothetical protein [Neospora caninum Liverpool]|uniref:Uncharacterized protein n=1 Tax=Neospora caninum (strain Liverpool) TaxID=572307 RepID=F0V852_NEOCL|nr:conserved hypothetical protein [Neospora caninum Liverpool]CBZ49893.1 conserved hypothetical protein [Neospora caninum Liverpool]CEL64480.1 TPA: hypothetical protein BN1204_003780 [Neospora caninum Liverpool]|eukprot:XP_003879928.1 conserved hypothetical protein [Neospora caninum Liverpool]
MWEDSSAAPKSFSGETSRQARRLSYSAAKTLRDEEGDGGVTDPQGVFVDITNANVKGGRTGDTKASAFSITGAHLTETKMAMEAKTSSTKRNINPDCLGIQRMELHGNADKGRIQMCDNNQKRYRRLAIHEVTVSSLKQLFLPRAYFAYQSTRNPVSGHEGSSQKPDRIVTNPNADLTYNQDSFSYRNHHLTLHGKAPLFSPSNSAARQPTTIRPSSALSNIHLDERRERRSKFISFQQLESRFDQLPMKERDDLVNHAASRAISHLEWLYEWQKKYAPSLLLVQQERDLADSASASEDDYEEYVRDVFQGRPDVSGEDDTVAPEDASDAEEDERKRLYHYNGNETKSNSIRVKQHREDMPADEKAESIAEGQALWDETLIKLKRKNIPNITYTVDQVNEDVGIFLERYRDAVWSLPLQQIVNATLNGGIFPELVERQAAAYPDLKRNVECNPE